MAHKVFWTEPASSKLRMNSERMIKCGVLANFSTKNEEALETILKEGEVEETKAGQKFSSTNDSKYASMYVTLS
jgi:hypothetical protein